MRKTLTALSAGMLAFAATTTAQAQTASANPLEASRPLPQGPSRWVADYSFLKDPAKRTQALDALRYIALGDSSWLSLSGDARYTYRTVGEPFFGLIPPAGDKDALWMQRLQLNADLHLNDNAVRVFLQLQNTSTRGNNFPTLLDGNGTDIAQAFVDANFKLGTSKNTIRAGRQEILLGQGTLFNIGDLRNVRFAWDGLRTLTKLPDGKQLQLFAMHPVDYQYGAWDNGTVDHTPVYGAYATLPLAPGAGLDVYGFARHMQDRKFQGWTGDEDRYTYGVRYFGNTAKFNWTWDVMGQAGEHAGRDISAWGIRSMTRYKLDVPRDVTVGMHFDIASGGKPNASTTHTFDPLYPKNGEYGLAGVTTQSNVIIAGPEVTFSVLPRSDLYVSAMKVWRQNTNDYVYMAGMNAIKGSLNNDERDIGTIYQFGSRWPVTSNLTFDLDFMQMSAGAAVKQAGGKDTRAMEARVSLAF